MDWDGTLVGPDGSWLPDSVGALRALRRLGFVVVVHSCRGCWPGGVAGVRAALDGAGFPDVAVWDGRGKPDAAAYVDDRAVRFEGDWSAVLRVLRRL